MMMQRDVQNDPVPEAASMERKADLYGKMSDSLRADAAKLRYEHAHPDTKLTQPE